MIGNSCHRGYCREIIEDSSESVVKLIIHTSSIYVFHAFEWLTLLVDVLLADGVFAIRYVVFASTAVRLLNVFRFRDFRVICLSLRMMFVSALLRAIGGSILV